MSTISTHILDTARGKPANGVAVYLESQNHDETWEALTHAWTDDEGRVKPFFLLEEPLAAGTYRLVFDTDAYFTALEAECFYPQVCVVFQIGEDPQHYHIPLLISPYGYSTYRGT
ncbi:MAG: hydroxyisourate hydrolase [Pyrinomonadaceae bacterium]